MVNVKPQRWSPITTSLLGRIQDSLWHPRLTFAVFFSVLRLVFASTSISYPKSSVTLIRLSLFQFWRGKPTTPNQIRTRKWYFGRPPLQSNAWHGRKPLPSDIANISYPSYALEHYRWRSPARILLPRIEQGPISTSWMYQSSLCKFNYNFDVGVSLT